MNSLITPNQMYQEDCIAFMHRMRDEHVLVDVIVTSPPYNMNKEYGAYKDDRERDDCLEWLGNIAKASHLILKNDGSFFLNIGNRHPELPFLIARKFEDTDYILQNTIHWIKSVSIDPEDIGRNNEFRNNDNISIGHFSPIAISKRCEVTR